MEETRKFTALTSNANKQNSRPLVWSGRHTRLKYQMVIACLVFYCIVEFGFKKFKLLPVELVGDPSQKVVILGTAGFALFSIVAFVVGTMNENVSKSSIGTNVLLEFRDARNDIDSLSRQLKEVSEPQYADLQKIINSYSSIIEANRQTLLEFDPEFFSNLDPETIKNISNIDTASGKLDLEKALKNYPDKLLSHYKNSDVQQGPNIVKSLHVVKILSEMWESYGSAQALQDITVEMKKENGKIVTALKDTKNFYESKLLGQISEAQLALDTGNKSLTKLLSRFNSLNALHLFERSGLSVWVPVLTSGLFFLIALRNAIPKIL